MIACLLPGISVLSRLALLVVAIVVAVAVAIVAAIMIAIAPAILVTRDHSHFATIVAPVILRS